MGKADTPYTGATVLDKHHVSRYCDVILVEKAGEVHLLYFTGQYHTGRRTLSSDILIEDAVTSQYYQVGSLLNQATVWIENEKIDDALMGNSFIGVQQFGTIYLLIGMVCAACESVLLWLVLRKRYSK